MVGVSAICILIAGVSLSHRAPASEIDSDPTVPPWAFAAAAILALVPAAALLPKFSSDAVSLSDPIFDHSKSAIIDAMTRLGLPPANPVFGAFGAPGKLVYYYLWHFSAAELALVTRASLRKIWSGEAYRDFRRALLSGKPPDACASCGLRWSL